MNSRDIDEYIRQTLFGVIPKDLWDLHKANKTSPFDSLSEEEARKVRRKFRKLKRKSNVYKSNNCESMWRKINIFLQNKL